MGIINYIEAPSYLLNGPTYPSLFLAGGITGCPDWQADMVNRLNQERLTLFNPRRANFPIDDPDAAFRQIEWEHYYLRGADAILFWFPRETLCPIVLYELGAWSMTSKQLFVGVHPDYKRRQDVEIQTSLVRPDVKIVYGLDDLALQVKDWVARYESSPLRNLSPYINLLPIHPNLTPHFSD